MAASFLTGMPLFEGLGSETLAAVERALDERRLGGNQLVFRAGDPIDGLWLIGQGAVVIRREVPGQPVERVRDLGPGEVFGEMEALDGTKRLFAARTLEPSRLHRLPLAPLRELVARHPAVEARLRSLSIHRRTSRLHALLAPSSRCEDRTRIDRQVTLALPDGGRLAAHLEDLSSGGACLSAVPAAWGAGQPVAFELGTAAEPGLLAVTGTVRWRRGPLAGIAFEVEPGAEVAHRRRVERAMSRLVGGG